MIDSHCHFDFDVFDGHREQVLRQCVDLGIEAMVIPGVDPLQWDRAIKLHQTHGSDCRWWLAFGVHPWWLESLTLDPIELIVILNDYIARHDAIAIGECGLDGSIDVPIERQQLFFEAQLQLACDRKLPLIIHAHRAHNDVLRLLARYRPCAGGVIHGFSGSLELAQQYWRLGFYLGVGGTITYPRAKKTRTAFAQLPLESLLLETDAPDMPLSGQQGEPNSPTQLSNVANSLAQLRNMSVESVKQQTVLNTRRLFSLN